MADAAVPKGPAFSFLNYRATYVTADLAKSSDKMALASSKAAAPNGPAFLFLELPQKHKTPRRSRQSTCSVCAQGASFAFGCVRSTIDPSIYSPGREAELAQHFKLTSLEIGSGRSVRPVATAATSGSENSSATEPDKFISN